MIVNERETRLRFDEKHCKILLTRALKTNTMRLEAPVRMDNEIHIHEQDLEVIQKLRIFDDDFMKEVFDGNMEATELVLNVVFDRDDIKVIKVVGQREIKGIEGHSVRLDIFAEDSEKHSYDVDYSDFRVIPILAQNNAVCPCIT